MKLLFAIASLLTALVCFAAEAQSWLRPLPPALRSATPKEEIPAERFFEVAASKEPTAESYLKDKLVIPQNQNEIHFFGPKSFECPASTQGYLVRAVYDNGGTGAFSLHRFGSVLLVSHGSLGAASEVHRTALLVCLRFAPTEGFNVLSGAM